MAGLNIADQAFSASSADVVTARRPITVAVEHTLTVSPVVRAAVPSNAKKPVRYPVRGAKGETIGLLTIPELGQRFPITEGTGAAELRKGVGHYSGSVLPGRDDNCVLSGHRDTVFRRLGTLKKGDKLIVETAAGRFTYAIARTRIVHKDDRTVIVPTDHAVLTLTTCYPFHYVGSAPDRYIISADLVNAK